MVLLFSLVFFRALEYPRSLSLLASSVLVFDMLPSKRCICRWRTTFCRFFCLLYTLCLFLILFFSLHVSILWPQTQANRIVLCYHMVVNHSANQSINQTNQSNPINQTNQSTTIVINQLKGALVDKTTYLRKGCPGVPVDSEASTYPDPNVTAVEGGWIRASRRIVSGPWR